MAMSTKAFNKEMEKLRTPLNPSKSKALKDAIIKNLSGFINDLVVNSWVNMKNEAVYAMWGVTWLPNYSGTDLFEILDDIPYEGGIFEDQIDQKEDFRDTSDDPDERKYLDHDIKSIEDHCWPGDVCVVDSNGEYRNINRNEVKAIFKDVKKNVLKSRFTVDDLESYENNKNELTGLIG